MSIENAFSTKKKEMPEADRDGSLEIDDISPESIEANDNTEQNEYEKRIKEQSDAFKAEAELQEQQDSQKAAGVLQRLKNKFGAKDERQQEIIPTQQVETPEKNIEGSESSPVSELEQGDEFFEAGKFYKVLYFTSPKVDKELIEPEKMSLEQARWVMDAGDKQIGASMNVRDSKAISGRDYAKDLILGDRNQRSKARKDPYLGRSFVAIDQNGVQINRYEAEVEKLNPELKKKITNMMDAIPETRRPNGSGYNDLTRNRNPLIQDL